MTTPTLTGTSKPHLFSFQDGMLSRSGVGPKTSYFQRDDHQIMRLENVAVFRTGTFRDMWGMEHTFDEFQLNTIIRNFDYMRERGQMPESPIRKGHPTFGQNPMDTVVGYVTALRSDTKTTEKDGRQFTFLVADFEIIDTDAQKAVSSGLWRNRSAEIGKYIDNDFTEYDPVFMGVAYVDHPAVEHLNEYSSSHSNHHIIVSEDTTVTQTNSPAAPAAPAAPAQPTVHSFSIAGASVSDPVAVQNYITQQDSELAAFRAAETERAKSERIAFVDKLVAENKIVSASKDSMVAFASSLDAAQFSAWREMQDAAPAPTVLGTHGVQPTGAAPHATPTAPEDAQFATSQAIVTRMAKAGMSPETIKATSHYKTVIAKDASFSLPSQVAFQ